MLSDSRVPSFDGSSVLQVLQIQNQISYLQTMVDANAAPGQLILTGSQQFE
jgi:hypothetical protein